MQTNGHCCGGLADADRAKTRISVLGLLPVEVAAPHEVLSAYQAWYEPVTTDEPRRTDINHVIPQKIRLSVLVPRRQSSYPRRLNWYTDPSASVLKMSRSLKSKFEKPAAAILQQLNSSSPTHVARLIFYPAISEPECVILGEI